MNPVQQDSSSGARKKGYVSRRGTKARRLARILIHGTPVLLGLFLHGATACFGAAGSVATVTENRTFAPTLPAAPEAVTRARLHEAFGNLPLSFEANRGQTAAQVRYLSRGSGYTLFLTPTEAVWAMRTPRSEDGAQRTGNTNRESTTPDQPIGPVARHNPPAHPARPVLRMRFLGASSEPLMEGLAPLPGRSHYLLGHHGEKGHTDIPTYAQVHYRGIYPGIDLIYYGNPQQLEYDFVVAPGADPRAIRFAFEGLDTGHEGAPWRIDDRGDLILQTTAGEVTLRAPLIFQQMNGVRQPIAGRYVLLRDERSASAGEVPCIGLEVASYDAARPLVIDPVLVYSTYLGSSGWDEGHGIAVDADGHAYVTGFTTSVDFPTENPLQPAYGTNTDAFVAKLDPSGSTLVYATYLGGSGQDDGRAIAVDAEGHAYVTGFTASTDFPTENALQPGFGGGAFDAFVAKLDPSGSTLAYATYLGGSAADEGLGIALDAAGHAFVTGRTFSADFPAQNALQPAFGGGDSDAFVAKLSPAGSSLVYATPLGGGGPDFGSGIAVDIDGNALVTGGTGSADFPTANPLQAAFAGGSWDAFVARVAAGGSTLVYSTYLGGNQEDFGRGIAVDGQGNAHVTGETRSAGFPTANALQTSKKASWDAFVSKLTSDGSTLVYSTYLGGNDEDFAGGIAVDADGNAYVTGYTRSTNFPTADPVLSAIGFGLDSFITKFDPSGSTLLYSMYLGGRRNDVASGIAVDADGHAYVTGSTDSKNFPRVNPLQSTFGKSVSDALVTKIAVVHDLAVTRIIAPKRVTLSDKRPSRTVPVKVQIQNRSAHTETIPDLSTLNNLVHLTVESWGVEPRCAAPVPVFRGDKLPKSLPLKLKPKQKLTVAFDVTFDCANDPARSTAAAPGHEDYRHSAGVSHAALGGTADDHPWDDDCPRTVLEPPFVVDPYPDGKIKDRGCGEKMPDKTFGGDVFTDVVQK